MFGAQERTLSPWRAERILFDEDGLLVVDKPPGIVVHGGPEDLRLSLVDRLKDFRAGSGQEYLGVHSRLDVGTSGALLFTTDPRRNLGVKEGLDSGSLQRRYVALVALGPEHTLKDQGTISLSLAFERGKAFVSRSSGKLAVTHYRVIARSGQRALVQLELETGRTHQIRVSLSHLGAPVIGDELYGGQAAPRIFLHAASLSGAPLPREVLAETPAVFDEWLERGHLSFPTESQEVETRLLDALTLRLPLLSHAATVRLVEGERDFLPGVEIDLLGGVPWVGDDCEIQDLPLLDSALERWGFGSLIKKSSRASAEIIGQEGRLRFACRPGERPPLLVEARAARAWLFEAEAERLLSLGCGPAQLGVAASVRALAGIHVDERATSLELQRESAQLSGVDPSRQRFLRDDPVRYLEKVDRRGERFDLVVIDAGKWGGMRLFSRLERNLRLCVRCVSAGGALLIWTGPKSARGHGLRRALETAAQSEGASIHHIRPVPSLRECARDDSTGLVVVFSAEGDGRATMGAAPRSPQRIRTTFSS